MGKKRGPAPTPSNLVLLRNDPGKRGVNHEEPKPIIGASCPHWLSSTARKEWRYIYPELKRLKLMTRLDREQLAIYCDAFATILRMDDILKKHEEKNQGQGLGPFVKTPSGYMQQHPALSVKNQAIQRMMNVAAEFGMTPAARTRLKTVSTGGGQMGLFDDLPEKNKDTRSA